MSSKFFSVKDLAEMSGESVAVWRKRILRRADFESTKRNLVGTDPPDSCGRRKRMGR